MRRKRAGSRISARRQKIQSFRILFSKLKKSNFEILSIDFFLITKFVIFKIDKIYLNLILL